MDIATYIQQYSYVCVLIIVLVQELGIPCIPNEWFLLYVGYWIQKGILAYMPSVLVCILADVTGAAVLYYLAFYTKNLLPQKLLKRLGFAGIDAQDKRLQYWSLFINRLTPFIKVYQSLMVGMGKTPFKWYLPILCSTAIIWNGLLIGFGMGLGTIAHTSHRSFLLPFLLLFTIVMLLCKKIIYKQHLKSPL